MARYSDIEIAAGLSWATKVNTAADFWREQCFFGDRSLFWQADLWALKNPSELHPRIEKFETGGDENYVQKLKTQLDGASRDAVRLDAELHWLLYLILLGKTVSGFYATTGPARKRENLQQILSIFEEELPSSRWLDDDEILMGLAANWRFNSNLYVSHLSLIKTLMKWKELAPVERNEFATAPWQFAKWNDQLHVNINSALRNTLLNLLSPDSFKDMVVQGDNALSNGITTK